MRVRCPWFVTELNHLATTFDITDRCFVFVLDANSPPKLAKGTGFALDAGRFHQKFSLWCIRHSKLLGRNGKIHCFFAPKGEQFSGRRGQKGFWFGKFLNFCDLFVSPISSKSARDDTLFFRTERRTIFWTAWPKKGFGLENS